VIVFYPHNYKILKIIKYQESLDMQFSLRKCILGSISLNEGVHQFKVSCTITRYNIQVT